MKLRRQHKSNVELFEQYLERRHEAVKGRNILKNLIIREQKKTAALDYEYL